MKRKLATVIFLAAACTSGEQRNEQATASSSLSTIVDSAPRVTAPTDSAAVTAYEDSLMRKLNFTEPHILPNGDTLRLLQYSFFDDPAVHDFTFLYYMRNGVRYVSVSHDTAVAAGSRRPVMRVASRIRLTGVDSTDYVILEGRCAINGKDDPLVVGVTGSKGDSVYRRARFAWRLDTAARVLREIPTNGVSCRRESGEE